MATTAGQKVVKGGAFLIEEFSPRDVFTPEDFTEEQKMIARTTEEFVENEVVPNIEKLEHKDWDLTVRLLRKAGELGLLGIEIPEKYGGLDLDKVSSMLVSEKLGRYGSFAVSYGGHQGIGTWPIIYFGNEEQKAKYLPKLATGELISAYALTEPHAGSDALALKTRADLSGDGRHYILNGSKMWITNASFADIFIVFAKVDGDKMTAFIVERNSPGLSVGKEEPKMGIRGSSTCALSFENVPVPVENLLGEIGKGHKVAFNCLNLGRFKLSAGCIGGSKSALNDSIRYARERQQFGRPIASFGAIKRKIAEMAIRTWVGESMVYRTGGLIDAGIAAIDKEQPQQVLKAIEEYAVECSIMKVMGSEILGYVVDEMVQIYGGYGYSSEYPADRAYRDARINRIFEGTNEINRLIVFNMLMKRAMSGELELLAAARKLRDEITAPPEVRPDFGLLAAERAMASAAKRIALFVAGSALERYREKIAEEQELIMSISDMVMEAYAIESALLRALKAAETQGAERSWMPLEIARVYARAAMDRVELLAREALAAVAEGDTLRTMLAALRRLARREPYNTIAGRRRIAEALIEAGRF